ncbi:MAG: glycosyltransferase [Gemmataceae bacterium]|uniref:Glycosyltransferase n=1 Tax=Thermogemmata fonticola TaxID=2755323 RepID=A0A7V9AAU7_9BACT|nr:glycosyltransferase family 2 protein [Thermogemmata fonticola]MBA2225097.1 glycosyltransferase [Thermogemmata fonticola]MCX8139941.1 glycosyltransferase [Gemmataceae bacterium]GIW84449.1 MAG: glycosyl transferase [Gemmataceae bacterium]
MTIVAIFCLACALLPTVMYLLNRPQFHPPPEGEVGESNAAAPAVSVLIPARNEEHNIVECVRSVLASRGVILEVVVLDDQSSDGTADLVEKLAQEDERVRLIQGMPLPEGWCGKQHACYQLAQQGRYEYLAFLDADVRLHPDALLRMIRFLETRGAALVSGFPRQITVTWLEKLLLPLIHFILLGFLPLGMMRRRRWVGLGAGCGQWFVTTQKAYHVVGGHASIRQSRHDGLTLPRAYRRHGFLTDIADATALAWCRMYRSAREVWNGLAKNAREGMASSSQIGFWTIVLFCGQVVPFLALLVWPLLYSFPLAEDTASQESAALSFLLWGIAAVAALGVRGDSAIRFRHSWESVVFHPLAITLLLAIQWYAFLLALIGRPIGWKGRTSA